tara:strand:+ start:239 stop:2218 length:1980 start_codon:yes stop_codon:yes gene_type:complete
MERNIKIIVLTTAYNCEKWIEKCIKSIRNQTYSNFHCYVLDDVSADETYTKALEAISGDTRFSLIKNKKKYYQVGNYDQILRTNQVRDDDIVIQVDGDDWLPDDEVFERVLRNYDDPDVWLTYGQFEYSDGRPGFAAPMHSDINIRQSIFQLCALRSWKVFLWKNIKQEDLFDESGWYPHRGGDTFFMFPMVEMATHKHIKFLNQVNYTYNEDNPINDHKVSFQEQKKSADYARAKTPYSPLNLAFGYLTHRRFDIVAKLMYAAFREAKIKSDFGEEVYKEHLRAFTEGKFTEYDNPEKNSYEKYLSMFDDILDSIRDNGFDSRFPVPIDLGGNLLNGSHRISACILHGKTPKSFETTDPRAGQAVCDSSYFRYAGLPEKYLDAMATEYAKIKSSTKVITLYPARNSSEDEDTLVDNLIKSTVPVVYEKQLNLNQYGLYNYISQMYFGEEWVSVTGNPLAGIRHQTDKCLGDSPVKVYLVECADLEKVNDLKSKIRQIYNIGKPSVHINDTHEQTIRAVRCAFNEQCIKFMNVKKVDVTTELWKLLDLYRRTLDHAKVPADNFCVTGSALLELYGLRKAKDLDYIHLDPAQVLQGNSLINSHEQELVKYPMHKHEILFNGFNHFFFNDIKFATLDVVEKLKSNRGEEKDHKDLELIKAR